MCDIKRGKEIAPHRSVMKQLGYQEYLATIRALRSGEHTKKMLRMADESSDWGIYNIIYPLGVFN